MGQLSHSSSVASDSMHSEQIDSYMSKLKINNKLVDIDDNSDNCVDEYEDDVDGSNDGVTLPPPGKNVGLKLLGSDEYDSIGMNLPEVCL